jgi:hypothetical protein
MKILFDDYCRTATITSLYEVTAYPASNIADVFLDTIYLSALPTDTITIDLLTDKPVDSLFIAGCNASSVDIEITSHTGTVLYSGPWAITREIETLYIDPVTCRFVKITVDVTGGADYVKIKGFGCGVSYQTDYILSAFEPAIDNNTVFTRSSTGQVLRNKTNSFRKYQATIPNLDRVAYNALMLLLEGFGLHYPTYFDMAENTTDFEQPIYGEIPEVWRYGKNGQNYSITIPIMECR